MENTAIHVLLDNKRKELLIDIRIRALSDISIWPNLVSAGYRRIAAIRLEQMSRVVSCHALVIILLHDYVHVHVCKA